MQEQIKVAREAIEQMKNTPAWAAAQALGAMLDAVEALAVEVGAVTKGGEVA